MRNFYVNVIPSTSHFTVGGLGYFGGEISARIVDLMWGKVIPRSTDWERDYRAVYGVVYDGSTAYDDEIVPATLEELRNFRSWLQRLETNDASAKGSTFILGNLSEGKFLAFTGEIDDEEDVTIEVKLDVRHVIRESLKLGNGIINDTFMSDKKFLEICVENVYNELLKKGLQ